MIDVTTGVSFGALALLAGAFAWLWNRLATQLAEEATKRGALADELADFRLEATRTFATAVAIEKTELRLVNAIDKMTARLETVIGRIEALSNELARAESAARASGATLRANRRITTDASR